jgi:hypothetical protein
MSRRTLFLALGVGLSASAALPFACGRSSETPTGAPPSIESDGSLDRAGPDANPDAGHDAPKRDAATDGGVDGGDETPAFDAGAFSDPAYWTPVPGLDKCAVRVAKPGNPLFAPKVWADCGEGCLLTSADLPGGTNFELDDGGHAGAVVAGELFVRFVGRCEEAQIEQIVRISDGMTMSAIALNHRSRSDYSLTLSA